MSSGCEFKGRKPKMKSLFQTINRNSAVLDYFLPPLLSLPPPHFLTSLPPAHFLLPPLLTPFFTTSSLPYSLSPTHFLPLPSLPPFLPPFPQLSRPPEEEDDEEGKSWLRTSKSFDNLHMTARQKPDKERDKQKSKTARFLTRIFKRKSMTPASLKRSSKTKSPNRDSSVSNASSTLGADLRDCLTASISMPDISSK